MPAIFTTGDSLWEDPMSEIQASAMEIHVWGGSVELPSSRFSNIEPLLSEDERQRGSRLVQPVDRCRFVAGRAMLRTVLAAYTGLPAAELTLGTTKYGKPRLHAERRGQSIQFNATGSAGWALIAVTQASAVGVDLEAIRPVHNLEAMLERCLTSPERAEFEVASAEGNSKQELFLRYWVAKEAGLKARGRGLRDPLDSVPLRLEGNRLVAAPTDVANGEGMAIAGFTPFEGFVGAVASLGGEKTLRFFRFPELAGDGR